MGLLLYYMHMDIVYIVGEESKNDHIELKYSLRSLKNLTHNKVFISGFLPYWVSNIFHISTEQIGTKYHNARDNIRAAARDTRVSSDFMLMNDDFFILKKMDSVPVYHRGKLADYLKQTNTPGPYRDRIEKTLKILSSLNRLHPMLPTKNKFSTYNYEMHIPIVVNKQRILELAECFPRTSPRAFRSLYCNYFGIAGKKRADVKFTPTALRPIPDDFFSTSNNYADTPEFRSWIHQMFPNKCKYEL